jgi:ankyrin repeat protein
VVKLLLEKGVDADSKGLDGGTPLYRAARNGHAAVVDLLREQGVNADTKDTALLAAARGRGWAIVKLLLEQGVDADPKDRASALLRSPLKHFVLSTVSQKTSPGY